jgi:holliday junction DNA helicase RuvA
MIYSIKGEVAKKGTDFVVIQTGLIGLKVHTNRNAVNKVSGKVEFFCKMYIKEDEPFIYGFLNEESLRLFEMLTSVSGVGPKTALNVFDLDTVDRITAAIIEKREEILTKTPGIGKKAAGRIILELHNKLSLSDSHKLAKTMDVDSDVEEALVNLGYERRRVKQAISEIGKDSSDIKDRLKEALKALRN